VFESPDKQTMKLKLSIVCGICSTQDWSRLAPKLPFFVLGGVEEISGFFLTGFIEQRRRTERNKEEKNKKKQ
jgi:hypothetical protein